MMGVLNPATLNIAAGASIVEEGEDAVIVATGPEVALAIQARQLLKQRDNINARVVSLSSWEIFREQEQPFRTTILPQALPTVAVEAGSPLGWLEFADDVIGMTRFGASAPASVIFDKLGFTAEAIANEISVRMAERTRA